MASSRARAPWWPSWRSASGHQPEVAGKPHQPAADLLKARFGSAGVVVGDRPDTDGTLRPADRGTLRPGPLGSHPARGPARLTCARQVEPDLAAVVAAHLE